MSSLDIYIRNEEDPNYEPGFLEVDDEFEMFLAQIEMVLETRKTEVLGEYRFGASLEEYVHTFNMNEIQIKNELRRQINEYCTLNSKFSYDIQVKFFRGSIRDIALIDVIVDGTKVFGVMVN